jgi:DNA-binding helix-hairpin-helix protein with protein kinase domain
MLWLTCTVWGSCAQVSTHDNLIPAAMQFELADQLRARTVTIPTGEERNLMHMQRRSLQHCAMLA